MTGHDSTARDAAMRLLEIGRADEALHKLRDGFDSDDAWCWFVRAAALLQLDRYDDCVEAAKAGLSVDPEHIHLLDVLAAARMGTADLAGAEDAILTALRIDAEDPDLLTRYAHVVARAGQMEKAEKLVARALTIDPENHYALQMDALLATASADSRAIIARSHALLRHSPENPLGHRLLGATHIDEGRFDQASDAFSEAVRLDPSHHETAESAREARLYRHWLLWPLRPALRMGAGPLWIAAVATILLLRNLKLDSAALWFSLAWVVYCLYTWIAPSVVRRLVRRSRSMRE